MFINGEVLLTSPQGVELFKGMTLVHSSPDILFTLK